MELSPVVSVMHADNPLIDLCIQPAPLIGELREYLVLCLAGYPYIVSHP
jgi:hypothetical protein